MHDRQAKAKAAAFGKVAAQWFLNASLGLADRVVYCIVSLKIIFLWSIREKGSDYNSARNYFLSHYLWHDMPL
jgi:hypothetical protein